MRSIKLLANHIIIGVYMKNIFVLSLIFTLVACSSQPRNNLNFDDTIVDSQSIKAFRDICLATAPSFNTAEQSALNYGIDNIKDHGFSVMGMTADNSLGVQIKKNKECVITTPSQENGTLTAQFLKAVSGYSSTQVLNAVPSKVTINSTRFIIMHDRKGGEAFVMLKLK
jgi:hypothetical protein